MSGRKDLAINKKSLLLGNKDKSIYVQNNRKIITFSLVKLQKLLESINNFSILLLSFCVVSMTGDRKGRKKGTYVFFCILQWQTSEFWFWMPH